MAGRINHSYFLIRRLHSLLGIFPIGLFLIWHLFANSYAFSGSAAYNGFIHKIQSLPLIWLFTILFVGLPILFHAVLGLIIFYTGRNNFLEYGYYKNWVYFFQRLSGVVLLIFLIVHAWETTISFALDGSRLAFVDMSRLLESGWHKWFYVIGMLAAAFHFTNGICGALVTWGITVSQRSQKVVVIAGWALFAILSGWGLAIMWAFV